MTDWHDEHSGVFTHLDWPAKSTDPNPLENLWDYLEQPVKRQGRPPPDLDQLHNSLKQEWLKMDMAYIQKHVQSMPTCITAVHACGGMTCY